MNEAASDSDRVSGQDRKIPPALGTNQIAGFRGFRPLASLEKKKKLHNKPLEILPHDISILISVDYYKVRPEVTD